VGDNGEELRLGLGSGLRLSFGLGERYVEVGQLTTTLSLLQQMRMRQPDLNCAHTIRRTSVSTHQATVLVVATNLGR
jgi:hypothetical protein